MRTVIKVIGWVLFAVFFLWTVFPIFWMLVSAFKVEVSMFTIPPKWLFKPSLINFKSLGKDFGIWMYIKNSIVAAGTTTVIAVIFGSMAGYGLSLPKRSTQRR